MSARAPPSAAASASGISPPAMSLAALAASALRYPKFVHTSLIIHSLSWLRFQFFTQQAFEHRPQLEHFFDILRYTLLGDLICL